MLLKSLIFDDIYAPAFEDYSFVMSQLDHCASAGTHEIDYDLTTVIGFYDLFKLV